MTARQADSAGVPLPLSLTVPPTLAQALIAWQTRHGRHGLPWQGSRDPYRVWLSEIMLQQTQVSTVLAYYAPFLARFPDVQRLAAAPIDAVLALWSGLGYYSRARHLHRCAQVVVAEHGGEFPRSAKALAELPGIGRSTAAAIAAFCFGERAAILDGNVKRVLSRVLGHGADLADARHVQSLWQMAEALLPEHGIEAYTQGLMDLGATVCTRRRPACPACPWAARCVARAEGKPEAYPIQSRRLRRSARASALLLLRQADSVWLLPRPASGIWAGLWTLPEWPDSAALQAATQAWPGTSGCGPAFKHVLTHLDWWLQPCWHRLPEALSAQGLSAVEQDLASRGAGGRWFPIEQALALGLPAPIRRLIEPAQDAALHPGPLFTAPRLTE